MAGVMTLVLEVHLDNFVNADDDDDDDDDDVLLWYPAELFILMTS